MKQLIRSMVFFTLLVIFGIPQIFAAAYSLTDIDAAKQSRLSFLMHSTDGNAYNVYIIGDGESYAGRSAPWSYSSNDMIYKAKAYYVYISSVKEDIVEMQGIELFGDNPTGHAEYINIIRPSYTGGVYLIKGVNGQPDILVSAKQMTGGGFVDYRYFAIKEGRLQQMKLMSSDQSTRLVSKGRINSMPYAVADGTIAVLWFRQRQGGIKDFGNFTSVYMPDYQNLILIFAYSYKE